MTTQSIKLLKEKVRYFRCIVQDTRTPRISKILLLSALAYLSSPIDLIPDFIPVLGQLDDIVIVPTLIWLALLIVPLEVKTHADVVSRTAT